MVYHYTVNQIKCISNFGTLKPGPLVICLHGNSSMADIFTTMIANAKFQMLAIDLPGCGKSLRLPQYSMQIVGKVVQDFIVDFTKFYNNDIYLLGHSLGGHLISFIDLGERLKGIILSGTPPLSSPNDFPIAFKPDAESAKLIPLLSKREPFTYEEAYAFVSHMGDFNKMELDMMVQNAQEVDGNFRYGCLGTLADIDQVELLSRFRGRIIIFHAIHDGVINPDYLESLLNRIQVYQNRIQYIDSQHMISMIKPLEMLSIMENCYPELKFQY